MARRQPVLAPGRGGVQREDEAVSSALGRGGGGAGTRRPLSSREAVGGQEQSGARLWPYSWDPRSLRKGRPAATR